MKCNTYVLHVLFYIFQKLKNKNTLNISVWVYLKLDYLKTKYNFVNYYGMFKQFWDNETTVGYKNPTTLFKDIFNRSNEVISADYISGEGKFKYSYNKTKQNVIIGKNQDGSYITKAITKKYDKEVSILRLLESIHYAFVLSNKTFQNSTPSISGFQELWEWHALTYNVGTNEMKQKVDLIKSILNNPHTNSLIKTILESGDYQKALSNHDYLKGEFQKTINTSLDFLRLLLHHLIIMILKTMPILYVEWLMIMKLNIENKK